MPLLVLEPGQPEQTEQLQGGGPQQRGVSQGILDAVMFSDGLGDRGMQGSRSRWWMRCADILGMVSYIRRLHGIETVRLCSKKDAEGRKSFLLIYGL